MRLTPDSLAAAAQRAKEREARAERCRQFPGNTCTQPATYRCHDTGKRYCEEHAAGCCRPLTERRRP